MARYSLAPLLALCCVLGAANAQIERRVVYTTNWCVRKTLAMPHMARRARPAQVQLTFSQPLQGSI